MNEELKEQYERDIESGYPEPWLLYKYRKPDSNHWVKFDFAIGDGDFLFSDIQRLPDADQIILDWQRTKYYEDSEWNPRPWELWEGKYKYDGWKRLPCNVKLDGSIYYRRRPDALSLEREQWEAEQEPKKEEREYDPLEFDTSEWKETHLLNRCAFCRHKYEPKQPTIHVSMQFPDGRTYEADLPEPMSEEPREGMAFWMAETLGPKKFIWGNYDVFNWQHKFLALGFCHATESNAQVLVDFFKQWRNDK